MATTQELQHQITLREIQLASEAQQLTGQQMNGPESFDFLRT